MANKPTHRAIATTAKGVLEQLIVRTEAPGHGEVQIKMCFASLTPFDSYQLDRGFVVTSYPLTLGLSGSGIVDEVGTGVASLKVGDKVCVLEALGRADVDDLNKVTAMMFHLSKNKSVQEYAIAHYSAATRASGFYIQ